jgi:hypothetical protein
VNFRLSRCSQVTWLALFAGLLTAADRACAATRYRAFGRREAGRAEANLRSAQFPHRRQVRPRPSRGIGKRWRGGVTLESLGAKPARTRTSPWARRSATPRARSSMRS